ncbi:MAG: hypothetical protein HY923_03480 [Elusimicrobia bacterium]|nr:hypothetical protein [Elusimicrobiota bacterium]
MIIARMGLVLLLAVGASAADRDGDAAAIKAQAGCFDVTYEFVETFGPKDRVMSTPYKTTGLEWIVVDEDAPGRVVLQHLLVISSATVMKHWRQEWFYEPSERFEFKGSDSWVKTPLASADRAGRWRQRVLQVDDGPRYECAAPWVRWGGVRYWECRAWSPLPRREFTRRSDYQVLDRRNRQELTANGWTHEQDNAKLKLEAGKTNELAWEKGRNTYARVAEDRCELARKWWAENAARWGEVRAAWAEVYAGAERLDLSAKPGEKPLWDELTALVESAPKDLRAKARDLILSRAERKK